MQLVWYYRIPRWDRLRRLVQTLAEESEWEIQGSEAAYTKNHHRNNTVQSVPSSIQYYCYTWIGSHLVHIWLDYTASHKNIVQWKIVLILWSKASDLRPRDPLSTNRLYTKLDLSFQYTVQRFLANWHAVYKAIYSHYNLAVVVLSHWLTQPQKTDFSPLSDGSWVCVSLATVAPCKNYHKGEITVETILTVVTKVTVNMI